MDILDTRSLYPHKRIFSGLEWNVPGHEHCSTAIVAKDASAISAFEYQFDKSDRDTSRTGEGTPYGTLTKMNGRALDQLDGKPLGSDRHADAVEGCRWMQKQYKEGTIDNGWIIFAHIERAGVFKTASSDGGYNVEHFRDFNNAGPDVCYGFEGAPGHQVNEFRGLGNTVTCVDGTCTSKDFGGTYGGVGYYTAKVGGLWDALLGEGRHWFNFANSDYHSHYTVGGDDFYPGEYQKTMVYAKNEDWKAKYSLDEIADGLRSGNSYFVHGDLINHLEFEVQDGWKQATMGEELKSHGKIKNLKLTIKFKSPMQNNCGKSDPDLACERPLVDHIDLIAGEITGPIDPSSPDYTKATNESTKVIASFSDYDWRVGRDGTHTIVYHIKNVDKNTYFRLRGTNVPCSTPNETGPATGLGTADYCSPLPDALAGPNNAQKTWDDLWFYSNPIFVHVK